MSDRDFQPVERDLYTVGEVARLFRVDRSTVYRWIGQGELQAVRIGGTTRVPLAEVRRRLTGSDEG